MPKTRRSTGVKPVTEWEVEYVWIAEDGHTRAFTERFDEPDEGAARSLLRELQHDQPFPRMASGNTCVECKKPRRIVGTLRSREIWVGSDNPRTQPAREVERWEWPETHGTADIKTVRQSLARVGKKIPE